MIIFIEVNLIFIFSQFLTSVHYTFDCLFFLMVVVTMRKLNRIIFLFPLLLHLNQFIKLFKFIVLFWVKSIMDEVILSYLLITEYFFKLFLLIHFFGQGVSIRIFLLLLFLKHLDNSRVSDSGIYFLIPFASLDRADSNLLWNFLILYTFNNVLCVLLSTIEAKDISIQRLTFFFSRLI